MFIKEIRISGFKSYRKEVIINNLSQHHNVVVGRNGAGKSNFFDAVRFILSDSFSQLRAEDRVQLLHEGAGASVLTAYVEIVFDNVQGRLPFDKDEVALRRIIGLKKDEYVLDRKNVSRTEVFNLLEAAGFSRSNPYYIVQQGKVAALCAMSDEARLELLKEVAGTRVYDERREESLRLMTETIGQREKIADFIETIEKRLTELEGEKDELKEFQALDKTRRCLEYAVLRSEADEARSTLEELETQRSKEHELSSSRHSDLGECRTETRNLETERTRLVARSKSLKQRRDQIFQQRSNALESKALAEVELEEVEDLARVGAGERMRIESELNELQALIESKKYELQHVDAQGISVGLKPEFEAVQQEEKQIKAEVDSLQRKILDLRDKRLRRKKNAGKAKAQRESQLLADKKKVQQEITKLKAELKTVTQEIAQLESPASGQEQLKAEKEKAIQELRQKLEAMGAEEARLKADRAKAHSQRQEVWRKEARLDEQLGALNEDFGRAERVLRVNLGNAFSRALDCVKDTVLKDPRKYQPYGLPGDNVASGSSSKDRRAKVYGAVYELIQTDSKFFTAVEVAGGSSLLFVVVDSDKTAADLVEVLKRQRAGRVTFIPLNRVDSNGGERRPPLAATQDAIPLMAKLRFDPLVRPAIESLFGRTMIARDMTVAGVVSEQQKVHCVTMDGNQVNKRGALTGGFVEGNIGKLEAARGLTAISETREKARLERGESRQENAKAEAALSVALGNLQKLETDKRKLVSEIDKFEEELKSIQRNEQYNESRLESLRTRVGLLEESIRSSTETVANLDSEIVAPELNDLTKDEEGLLDQLTRDSEIKRGELDGTTARRMEAQAKYQALKSELENNLERRAAELQAKLHAGRAGAAASLYSFSSAEELQDMVQAKRDALQAIIADHDRLDTELNQVQSELVDVEKQIAKCDRDLDKISSKIKSIEISIVNEQERMDVLFNKKSVWTQKKADLERKIRELGSLPADHGKFLSLDNIKLMRRLSVVNAELRKYEHVNKKALEQYMAFADRRDDLKVRKDELDEGARSIQDMISSLDERKENDILRTFRGVSKNFSEVFAELVPTGKATLVMLRSAADENGNRGGGGGGGAATELHPDEVHIAEQGARQSKKRKKKLITQVAADAQGEQAVQVDEGMTALAQAAVSGAALRYTGVAMKVSFDGKETFLIQQLSGGQKSLVALALIFAIQRLDPAPFYLFDEIDANLDATHRTAVAALIKRHSAEGTQFITTTFRPEIVLAGDAWFGVTHRNKVSSVDAVSKDQALEFINNDPSH